MPNITWSAAGYVQSLGLKSAESAKFRLILLFSQNDLKTTWEKTTE